MYISRSFIPEMNGYRRHLRLNDGQRHPRIARGGKIAVCMRVNWTTLRESGWTGMILTVWSVKRSTSNSPEKPSQILTFMMGGG
jgi:hypothetical protein